MMLRQRMPAVGAGLAAIFVIGLVGCVSSATQIAVTEAPVEEMEAPIDTPVPTVTDSPTDTPEPTATEELPPTPDPNALFHPVSSEPIFDTGSRYSDPGAVIYHDGQFHMFMNVFNAWPARVDVYYLRSDDGLNWERVSDEPVFNEKGLDYVEVAVLASSAMVLDDGTWVLFFTIWQNNSSQIGHAIGRATAPSPEGPWTGDPAPVLEGAGADAWDSTQVANPSVVRIDEGYVMIYAGRSGGVSQIGRTASPDGVNWTNARRSALSPSENGWDSASIWQPNVVRTDDEGWVMVYKGASASGLPYPHGVALSEFGLDWTRKAPRALIEATQMPGGMHIWFTNLVALDGTYYLFYELAQDASSSRTAVYVATCECSMFDD